jgi:cobalt-zinc-cadmium efflux system protein
MQHKGPDPHSPHGDHDHDHGAPGHGHDPDHGGHHGHDHDPAMRSGHAPDEDDGHVHSHAHSHALTADGINARMGIAVGLNVIFVAIEGTFGFLSNSVALIADAGHNLGDVLGLVCAWTAIRLARRPPGGRFT